MAVEQRVVLLAFLIPLAASAATIYLIDCPFLVL